MSSGWRKRLWVLLGSLIALAGVANAEDPQISIVLSRAISPYVTASEGIQDVLRAANVRAVHVEHLGIAAADIEQLADRLAQHAPRVIVTIGTEATQAITHRITAVPVVFSMVVHPEPLLTDAPKLFGVSMEVPAGEQLARLSALLPLVHRTGLLYPPALHTAETLLARETAAHEQSLELVLQPVNRAADVPDALRSLLGRVDALWLIPDETVLAPELLDTLFLETLRARIPVLAPAFLFVQRGALLAVGSDYRDVGRQSGELAVALLHGKRPAAHVVEARKSVLYLNLRTAKTLGITIPQSMREQAAQVVE